MTTTRYPCPLDCGWHHDVDHTQLPAAVDVPVPAGASVESLRDAVNIALLKRTLDATEGALRAHLESHTLEHWTRALANTRDRAIRAERALAAIDRLVPVLGDVHGTLADWKQGR